MIRNDSAAPTVSNGAFYQKARRLPDTTEAKHSINQPDIATFATPSGDMVRHHSKDYAAVPSVCDISGF